MKLGAFSLSLAVKDLEASKVFYEKLGFERFAGKPEHRYYIMKNGDALIGLFQGMFPNNLITFNPGWNQNANILSEFEDVREIQRQMIANGITPANEVEGETGPGSFMITDPDGNTILIDQHV